MNTNLWKDIAPHTGDRKFAFKHVKSNDFGRVINRTTEPWAFASNA